jgi:hypothetical protein
MGAEDGTWSVDDHLRDAKPEHVALFWRIEKLILGCGEVTLSVSKTTITFKGRRRGFAGARPTAHGVRGYLDLTRSLAGDPRIKSSAPYTMRCSAVARGVDLAGGALNLFLRPTPR